MVLPAVLAEAWTLCAWCSAWFWFWPTKYVYTWALFLGCKIIVALHSLHSPFSPATLVMLLEENGGEVQGPSRQDLQCSFHLMEFGKLQNCVSLMQFLTVFSSLPHLYFIKRASSKNDCMPWHPIDSRSNNSYPYMALLIVEKSEWIALYFSSISNFSIGLVVDVNKYQSPQIIYLSQREKKVSSPMCQRC